MRRIVPLLLLACVLGQRPGVVVRVIDGDTVVLRLRLGFETLVEGPCRLAGIDAPEMRQEGGIEAKLWLMDRLLVGESICFAGEHRDRWGRPIVTIRDQDGDIARALVAAGHAK